jgi:formate hydrogenlyase subunit 3/multisubunit Na+/H+ antiporter MnhD subunit
MGIIEILLHTSWVVSLLAIVALFIASSRLQAFITGVAVTTLSVAGIWLAMLALQGQVVDVKLNAGLFFGPVSCKIDALSAWFLVVVSLLSLLAWVYGNGYLKSLSLSPGRMRFHWIVYILLVLSMQWVCVIQNGFVFLLVWEVMSLSSMLLAVSDLENSKAVKAAIHYLVQMHISGMLLAVGFIWVYFQTGSFEFDALATFFSMPDNIWVFVLFAVGFGLKAEFVPLHGKVPNIYPFAFPHVAVLMSGAMVKLGIYGIVRISTYLQADWLLLGEIILTVSILSALYGALFSAVHRDFKRMLAYCTIENVGVIGIGIGMGMIGKGTGSQLLFYLGFGGALLHVLNHALYKSLLFMSGGAVSLQSGVSNMDHLGGVIKKMPHSAFLFLMGAIAVCGIPPLNGFVSEFIIYSGLIEGMHSDNLSQLSLLILCFGGLSIVGGISLLAFTKNYGVAFLGTCRDDNNNQLKEVSWTMLLPQYLIVVIMLVIAFIPSFFIDIANDVVLKSFNNHQNIGIEGMNAYSSLLTNVSLGFGIFMAVILLVWWLRQRSVSAQSVDVQPTWGCAYQKPSSRIQYTGKSFSKPLGKIFNFWLIEKKSYLELEKGEVFPAQRKYSTHYADFFEIHIVDRVTQFLVRGVDYLKFIQNGHIQSYVLYGIVFILAIFALTLFEIIQ